MRSEHVRPRLTSNPRGQQRKGRLYDPALRRFTTADPYVTEPLNPQGLNRYSYVQNNPMNFVDPSGFDSCPPVTYETEGGSVTVYPTGCGQSGNGQPTNWQQQNQQNQNTYQQNSQNSQQTTQYYADQSQQRAAEQGQAQNMLANDANRAGDLGFTSPYTSPNPNDLNNGGPRLGFLPDDRTAQAAINPAAVAGVAEGAAAAAAAASRPPPPNERRQLDRAVRELFKTVEKLVTDLSTEVHRELKDMGDTLTHWAKGAPNIPEGYTDKVGKVAAETGKSIKDINDAIHEVKRAMDRGGSTRNPDVLINPKTGDVRPKTPSGAGDSIGNIFDHLE